MKLLKDLGLFTFIFLLLISLVLIAYPIIMKPSGVVVTSVGVNSPCEDIITVGSTITGVGNKIIKDSDDFIEAVRGLEGVVTFMINGNPRSCNIPKEIGLNVTVTNMESGGIKLGTDVQGGIYYIFEPQEFTQDLIGRLKERATKYELSNTKIESYNKTLIKITTSPDEENYLNLLVERGRLEGKIIQTVEFGKKTVEFLFNDKTYEITLKNEKSVEINGTRYEVGQDFKLDGVDVAVENISKNMTTLSFTIFHDEDLTIIQSSRLGYSRIIKQSGGYLFAVPVELSEKASENFKKGTKNLEVLVNPSTGESYSKFPLSIFIDGKPFIDIPILSSNMGKKINDLVLWGYSPSVEEATKNMMRLKTIVETKSLPQELMLVKRDRFKSSYGEVLTPSLSCVILAIIITILLFFFKFHKKGVASFPLVLLVLSEIAIILGVASVQWFALLIFFAGVMVVLLRGEIHDWKCWVGMLLFFLLIVGLSMRKWIVNAPMIFGLTAITVIGLGQGIYTGMMILKKGESYSSSDYKKLSMNLWMLSISLSFVLLALYFVAEMFIGFLMAFSIGLWINLSILLPAFAGITKKFIK